MLNNNVIAAIITLFAALAWLRINDFAAHRGWIRSQVSRKIIHMGTGPIFVLCWLLFTDAPNARYLAALVPLLITVQFALVGLGVLKDDAAVQAMSRTGNPREILRGPLFYGLVFVVVTVFYWKDSPIGIVALMLMCGGDGLADIVGRRWGTQKLPWAKDKSWIGSLGMLAGGWLFSIAIVYVFIIAGEFPGPLSAYILPLSVIALADALVESIPIRDIDNITVTATAIALGHWLL
ncbi:MAG: phosphatidate cytidylyltransferase [Chloroflexi bacterium]|nr:MAG: phosphatidate cytidylyltransferase [Chloroflexota bacterium]MBL1195772.1 phosphatidate cytidylyltransferase [Chloroflexota bacterium]NOH13063.1 phosphatidate cytidylyltransferase [Chloroflexota bacterium]